jgi:hypothetical protein
MGLGEAKELSQRNQLKSRPDKNPGDLAVFLKRLERQPGNEVFL